VDDTLVRDYATLNGVSHEDAKDILMDRLGRNDEDLVLPVALRPAVVIAVNSHDQLRTIAGLGGIAHIAFDQPAVESVARMHGQQITPQIARDLHILQAEGLRIMAVSR